MISNLEDVKTAMAALYDEVKAGKTELKKASELANIAGKYLKAEALQLAREIFVSQPRVAAEAIPAKSSRVIEHKIR